MPEFDSTIRYKQVEGFPGYAVGSDGSVWSCRSLNGLGALKTTYRELKQSSNRTGHRLVTLKGVTKFVHRLILESFIGPCPAGMEACHFPDRSPSNNNLDNLRWDTRSANHADMIKHGSLPNEARSPRAKLTGQIVRSMRMDHASGMDCKAVAKKYKVPHVSAWEAITGRTWSHIL